MKLSVLGLVALVPNALAIYCASENLGYDPLNITAAPHYRSRHDVDTRSPVTMVKLYIHAIYWDNPGFDLDLLQAQVRYVNERFEKWGLQFDFNVSSRWNPVKNEVWVKSFDVNKDAIMDELRRGDYRTANLYLVEGQRGGVCSLPVSSTGPLTHNELRGDGCFVPLMSGFSATDGTIVHELGHWFGLLHTFNGGCGGTDYCEDTAPQSGPSHAKMDTPGDLNSCTSASGQCAANTNVNNHVRLYPLLLVIKSSTRC
jgi:hypothetical protein